jgi:hypothetical protein
MKTVMNFTEGGEFRNTSAENFSDFSNTESVDSKPIHGLNLFQASFFLVLFAMDLLSIQGAAPKF